ncbi:MAG: SDR family NAD(P)-dependent oxidoreductase, partial [Clostridia bacterium]|nr:SDR family NAD(P)-dependent oxidoreductase [Clostridia bacterium]
MKRYNINLEGKNVAITGAAGAICGQFAIELAKVGAKVALLDINLEKAQEVADQINANGGFARAYYANVLSRESLE